MRPIVRYALLLAAVLLVALAFVAFLLPRPVSVDVARVDRGLVRVTVDAEGRTRVRDRYVIAAPVSGHLERIAYRDGDAVTRDAVVARIDPLAHTSAVREALANLDVWRAERAGVASQRVKPQTLEQASESVHAAEIALRRAEVGAAQARAISEQAQRDLQRSARLAASGAVPRRDYEQAQTSAKTRRQELDAAVLQVASARAELAIAHAALRELKAKRSDPDYLERLYDARIAAAEAELDRMRDEAARTVIRSPVSGRVLRVRQTSAQFVTAGTPLLELGDPRRIEIVVDVLSADAARVRPGDRILVDAGGGLPQMLARVRSVEPSAFTKVSALGVEEQRVNVVGDFNTPPQGLGDGYRVDASIVIWEGTDVVRVPNGALFRCGAAWCVFTVEGGRAHRRVVAVGQRNDADAQVLSGLRAGETVVLHPADRVGDGVRVAPR